MADFARSTASAASRRSSTGLSSCRPPATGSGSTASARCSTGSAGRRTGCRRCSTSPGPTARDRPCAFLRAALEAAGHTVHAFTSPHLVRFNERIRVAGRLIDDEELAGAADRGPRRRRGYRAELLRGRDRRRACSPSRELPADACILEVGLGGRLDATNVIERPLVTGIANLGLDHQHFLGDTPRRHRRRESRRSPSPACRWSRSLSAAAGTRMAEIAARRGAIWLPRGGAGTLLDGRELRYRDARAARSAAAAPARRATRRATPPRRGDAPRTSTALACRRRRSARRWAAARWPARLQRLAAGPLIGDREVWLDGGHNPRRAPGARSRACARRRQAAAPRLREPRDQRSRRHARAVRGAGRATCTCVPIPGHAHRARRRSRDRRRARASPPTRMTASQARWRAIPDGARRADLRLALPCRHRARRQRRGARLGLRAGSSTFGAVSASPRRALVPRPAIHSRMTKKTARRPAAAVQRNTRRIAIFVERLAGDAAAERADQERQRRQQRILDRGELLADDAREISDEGGQRRCRSRYSRSRSRAAAAPSARRRRTQPSSASSRSAWAKASMLRPPSARSA